MLCSLSLRRTYVSAPDHMHVTVRLIISLAFVAPLLSLSCISLITRKTVRQVSYYTRGTARDA